MTDENSAATEAAEGRDQQSYPFGYGHGRMPLFMKLAWVGVLIFMTWYIVRFLLTSVGAELAK